ncbi:hypothetical protein HYU11_01640 [Candidatus Woesearchaeota archaeon]|nr:hypothetical protein [Candidatus Woesearchaeota archaeon]
MQKKGLELSINFFVIIFLSTVILGLGIKMLYDMCGRVGCFDEPSVDSCPDEKIDTILADRSVVVCPSDITIPRGKSVSFKVGILNPESATKFRVVPEVSVGERKDGTAIDALSNFKFVSHDTFDLAQNRDRKMLVMAKVLPEAQSGLYSIDVNVCSGASDVPSENDCISNPNFGVTKLYIRVP